MLYFICPKTASGSIGRFDLCISPLSDVRRSLALLTPVASPPERTSLASLRPVYGTNRPIATLCPVMPDADLFHVLSHRADEVVLLFVIVQVLHAEDVLPEVALLLPVEVVVLDVCLNVACFHE